MYGDTRTTAGLLDSHRRIRSWTWVPAPRTPADPDAWAIAARIADAGILRDVTEDDMGRVHLTLRSTQCGRRTLEAMQTDLVDALTLAGFLQVDVEFVD